MARKLSEGLDGDPIVIPCNDRLTALIGALPLQLIAYELAVLKGINPDTPRNLAKVRCGTWSPWRRGSPSVDRQPKEAEIYGQWACLCGALLGECACRGSDQGPTVDATVQSC